MMASSQEEKTDATSIKPVSSLLSHFEGMHREGSQPGPIPAVQRVATISTEVERGRSSMDTARRASEWNAIGGLRLLSEPATTMESTTLLTGNSRSSASPRARPVSMGPLSVGWASEDASDTQSPNSPFSSQVSRSTYSEASTPSLLSPTETGLRFRQVPPLPQSRPRGWQNPAQDSTQVPDSQIKGTMPVGISKRTTLPPPINRAEKPRIFSNPSSPAVPSLGKLEAPQTTIKASPSPFSTPSTSDEGEELGSSRNSTSRKSSTSMVPQVSGSQLPPPPNHLIVGARRGSKGNITTPPESAPSTLDPRLYRKSHTQLVSQLVSPPPPALPLRREASETAIPLKERHSVDSPRPRILSGPPPRPPEISKLGYSARDFAPPPSRTFIKAREPQTMTSGAKIAAVPRTTAVANREGPPNPYNAESPAALSTTSISSDTTINLTDYPDASRMNRRAPRAKVGIHLIDTKYETKLFEISGRFVCATGYLTRAWDSKKGRLVLEMPPNENKEFKVTSMAFKAGVAAEAEGLRVWLGSNHGDIQEVDLTDQSIIHTKHGVHARREVIRIYRQQCSMWSLDDDGRLLVWLPDSSGLPDLINDPTHHRITKGHTFSILVGAYLWVASGKDVRIYRPGATDEESFYVVQQPLHQAGAGEITSGAIIADQADRVYFGHNDGKVTLYSTSDFACLGLVNVSVYKINCLVGAGSYLWAGFNTGMIFVFDTRCRPWLVKKEWQAHEHPVANFSIDESSLWRLGYLQVGSIGMDNSIRLWDGMLEDDWLENDMQEHDVEYSTFEEIKAVVVTWNAGASVPTSLRNDGSNNAFVQAIQVEDPPDIIVFGFQELVDLEDKRLTAKSFFMGGKKKDSSEHEHMSRQYRAWRDYLVRLIQDSMSPNEPYSLLQTASMVGLFSCIFIRASRRDQVSNLQVAEVKRGLGGLHGNKGAIIVRFLLNDSSMCLVNCHLAAGQSQTIHRNNDMTAILEAAVLPAEKDPLMRSDNFVGGGDGSMIMDHEICILNGDLNYRIDTMGRDTVVKAVKANNLGKLLDRDQLLVSRRRNPGFRLRSFIECPITFAPTYKYDVGTDNYDSSEKNRSPAWCDRLLYRGVGRIKQLDYRRHDLRTSDHRPVSGTFKMRIKTISPEKRNHAWTECEERLAKVKQKVSDASKIYYLVKYQGMK